jgi:hypothetical protein
MSQNVRLECIPVGARSSPAGGTGASAMGERPRQGVTSDVSVLLAPMTTTLSLPLVATPPLVSTHVPNQVLVPRRAVPRVRVPDVREWRVLHEVGVCTCQLAELAERDRVAPALGLACSERRPVSSLEDIQYVVNVAKRCAQTK